VKTIKTPEASSVALDWLVREALTGHPDEFALAGKSECYDGNEWGQFSTDWAQGGSVIEAMAKSGNFLIAGSGTNNQATLIQKAHIATATGPTILIAAMRCYVISKLGLTVEVPEELL